jgi:hypothetical protein
MSIHLFSFDARPFDLSFRLRELRKLVPGTANTTGLHTSYALQCGYDQLIRQLGTAARRDVEQIQQRPPLTSDTRDLLAARDSLKHLLLGISQLDA